MLHPNLIQHDLSRDFTDPETGKTTLVIESKIGDLLLAKCALDVTTPHVFVDNLVVSSLGAFAFNASMSNIAWYVMDAVEDHLVERGAASISVAPMLRADGSFESWGYRKTNDYKLEKGLKRPILSKRLTNKQNEPELINADTPALVSKNA